jgi:hypothetical protein
VALYALAGFFLTPWLVERRVRAVAEESLGRKITVGKVKVNPFSLTLTLEHARLDAPFS